MNVTDFEQLILAHGKSVYGFICKMTGNPMDAEDFYQQTFLKAFEMLDEIESEQYPKAFLISIFLGLYRNKRRKEGRHNRIAPTIAITEDNQESLASDVNLEVEFIKREESEMVMKCVSLLDEKFRIPILLHYNAQLSVEEIANVIKKPVGTVKTRLKRGRELIKKGLEEAGYEQ
ncbi:MAG: RNA polymerase sigma factor [Clostridia bacterium]|nr:RNA polymerase sigma factor [Clostridia bacterium]